MVRFNFRLRTAMIAALMIGMALGAVRVILLYVHLSRLYEARAYAHADAARANLTQSGQLVWGVSQMRQGRSDAELERRARLGFEDGDLLRMMRKSKQHDELAHYHERLLRKYEYYSYHPWLTPGPDPEPPGVD